MVPACAGAGDGPAEEATDEQLLEQLQPGVDETALDRSVRPCDDFYRFACGGYIASHANEDPEFSLAQRVFGALDDANRATLDAIIAEAQQNPKTALDTRLANFYGSCVAARLGPKDDPRPQAALRESTLRLERIRQEEGLSAALAEIDRVSSRGSFLRSFAQQDPLEPTRGALFITPPASSTLERDAAKLERTLANLYALESPAARAERARIILPIENAIAATLEPADPRPHPLGKDGLRQVLVHVDWDVYLGRLGLPKAKRIYLVNINALTQIDAILARVPESELATYLDYRYAFGFALSLNAGISAGAEGDRRARAMCDIILGEGAEGLIAKQFTDRMVTGKTDRSVRALFRAIRDAAEKRLVANELLDPATRAEAILKLRAMAFTPIRGDVDDFADATFVPDSFVENWETLQRHRRRADYAVVDRPWDRTSPIGTTSVNAFHSFTENRIQLNAGIVHGSMFGPNAPRFVNFGALGWVIGHEVIHGFDNLGRHFDLTGRERDWWTPSVADAFASRSACFVDAYNAFVVPEALDPATGEPMHLDGTQTLGENIADHGGMRAAYDAAAPFFAKGKPDKGFNPEQQFFVSAAQSWCEVLGSNVLANLIENDEHSPGRARVNLSIAHDPHFAKAFQCAPTDKMVATPQCQIW